MSKIKLVAFDLGGVLFEWQTALYEIHKLTNLGLEEIHHFLITNLRELEIGKVTPLNFWQNFISKYNLSISPQELNQAWIKGFVKHENIWNQAQNLKKSGIKLAICSNSWPELISSLKKLHEGFEIFDYTFDSTEIGFVKPEAEYFKFVEEKTGFKGPEILLIDDSIENLEGAKNCGWQIKKV